MDEEKEKTEVDKEIKEIELQNTFRKKLHKNSQDMPNLLKNIH